jgi:hypothetical protein
VFAHRQIARQFRMHLHEIAIFSDDLTTQGKACLFDGLFGPVNSPRRRRGAALHSDFATASRTGLPGNGSTAGMSSRAPGNG